MKKRPKLDVSSPILRRNFEASLVDITEEIDDDRFEQNLKTEWKNLARNMNVVKEMNEGLKQMIEKLSAEMTAELEGVDIQMSSLTAQLGKCPRDLGMLSAFGTLTKVFDELDRINQGLAKCTSFVENDPMITTDFKREIYEELTKSLQPMFALFHVFSKKLDRSRCFNVQRRFCLRVQKENHPKVQACQASLRQCRLRCN